MRFAVIERFRGGFPLAMMCRLLEVSRSGFHAASTRAESSRSVFERRLRVEVRAAFKRSRNRYGSPRIVAELRDNGIDVGRRRTARIMRQEGLVARKRRRWRHQSTPDATRSYPRNILARKFEVRERDSVWVADITEFPALSGRLYFAVVIDLYSRRVVGWAVASHVRASLAVEALQLAIERRRPSPGLLHHSDRGSQYFSEDYNAVLRRHAVTPSMSRRGNCWDNAVAESFFSTLKTELLDGRPPGSLDDARRRLFEYIEVFYNRQRRHSTLGQMSPADFENINRRAAHAA